MAAGRISVGLLGCGTVGGGVLRLIAQNAARIEARVGAAVEISRILVRESQASRGPYCDASRLTTRAAEVVDDPGIDVVVEVMGGQAAHELILRALERGKSVVTANKLLIASEGCALLAAAHRHGVDLAFEGAVGGGIPIVRTLRDAFASDAVTAVTGIVNGTSNYVLTRMVDAGLSLEAAVAEAQALGYAEADPSMDVDGHDAAHKLQILALLAFGAFVPPGSVHVEGIAAIEPIDHRMSARFGHRIKHLVVGRDHGDALELRVHPTLVPERSVLANVSGVLNGVVVTGRALGPCLVTGQGAGAMPTAVSVVSDLMDVARAKVAKVPGFGTRGLVLASRPIVPMAELSTRYYLRFVVADEPGVVAAIAGELAKERVSIEQMVQEARPAHEGGGATIVMLTHRAREASVQAALSAIGREVYMRAPPRLFRIEDV
ncbi:MAG: homoserine dehydrogenase [Myxococcales bacterium]|nr:homoserine dehydrogenase [Myxococcales bacterium]